MAEPTRQVDQYALDNLRRASRQAEIQRGQLERNLQDARRQLDVSARELAKRASASPEEIQRMVEREARKLSAQIDGIRTDFGVALGQQNLKLRKELDTIRQSVQTADKRLDSLEMKIDKVTKQFDADLRAIVERISRQKDRAQVYLNQLEVLLEQINTLHPEKLTPGQVEQIRESEKFVKVNIANSDFQAAIGIAQTAIRDAVQLLAELERLNKEFNDYKMHAQAACLEITMQIKRLTDTEANRKVIRMGSGDEEREYTYEGNIEFWTDGIFTQLCDAYAGDEKFITETFIPQMDIENLKRATESIPSYRARLELCQKLAEDEFSISCAVQDTAMAIYTALTKDGTWQLKDSGFDDSDIRRSYMESFEDALANTVQVFIFPGGIKTGASASVTFSVGAFSPNDSEGMRDILLDAVVSRLAACGVDMKSCLRRDAAGSIMNQNSFAKSEFAVGEKLKRSRLDYGRRAIVPAEHMMDGGY